MRRALGKGLSQLLGEQFSAQVSEIAIDAITPNKRQPRRHFDQDALEELADSIRVHGVLSPILVRPLTEGKYELIAGERRWRASKLAGLNLIPAVVRAAAGQDSLELAIIENVQREDISAYEAALAYKALVEEFGLNQEDVAMRVGKTRTSISNTLRLLKLPQRALDGLQEGQISEGHARALLSFGSEGKQLLVYEAIVERGLSVREVERLAKESAPKQDEKKPSARQEKDIYTRQLEGLLSERFGSPAKIDRKGEQGMLQVAFYNDDDLQRILDLLGVSL
jgi:ParB family transcriptional regulator, chromosome partitioning protein